MTQNPPGGPVPAVPEHLKEWAEDDEDINVAGRLLE